MKRIAIISDTHSLLRDTVRAELDAADIILHAGDITNQSVLNELESYPELHIVRGNNDLAFHWLPDQLRVTIEGVRFLIVHQRVFVPRDITGVDVVIFGHTHQFEAFEQNNILFLNPGSCGKRRFDYDISMVRMTVDNGSFQYEKLIVG